MSGTDLPKNVDVLPCAANQANVLPCVEGSADNDCEDQEIGNLEFSIEDEPI